MDLSSRKCHFRRAVMFIYKIEIDLIALFRKVFRKFCLIFVKVQ